MRESLYDRLRPFKPYDLALSIVLILLVADRLEAQWSQKSLVILGGLALVSLMAYGQRLVRVPTPFWQGLGIIGVNTFLIFLVADRPGIEHFILALYILNCGFVTIALGERFGLVAAALALGVIVFVDWSGTLPHRPVVEWALIFALLCSVVAILARVNLLHEGAVFDAVTGLRNHRFFQVRLREELHRSDRFARPTSLLIVDLDDFKKVNDRFGHAMGDKVLEHVGKALTKTARLTDVVCRYGGEEFAIILPETSATDALVVAERTRAALERMSDIPNIHVTGSVGVASYPGDALDADSLVEIADAAMYHAKRCGKNQIRTKQGDDTSAIVAPAPSAPV